MQFCLCMSLKKNITLCLLLISSTMLCFEGRGQVTNSLRKVNKKFLVTLQITQDQAGTPAVDATRLTEIEGAIAGSSSFFDPLGISFEVGEVYYIDNYQFNVISTEAELTEMANKYDRENRLNVYLFQAFDEDLEGGCGFAGQIGAANKNMWFSQACVNAGSFAHESGHFFGLPHTFGAGDVLADPFVTTTELVDGSNCNTDGDQVCDTPADPYIPNDDTGIVWIEDCAYVYDGQDANGDYYDPDIGNIMSYYFEGCACGLHFTHGQYEKMSATFYNEVGPPPANDICIW